MTITEIARMAGVSTSTVSKIVNHKDKSISPETRKRVLNLVKKYNYRPYASFRRPAEKTRAIGALIKKHSGFIQEGIIASATHLGYSVVFRDPGQTPDSWKEALDALLELHVDGMIIDPPDKCTSSLYSKPDLDYQYVIVDPADNSNSPAIDYAALGFYATEALIAQGHSSIACMLGPGSRKAGLYNGYRRCLFDHGIPFNENLVFSSQCELPIERIVAHAFEAILTSHFHDALRLYRSAIDLRYEIPYDLSIVSLRGDENAIAFPEISSVPIPRKEYGAALAKHLIAKLESGTVTERFITHPYIDNNASIDVPYDLRMKRVIVIGSINVDNYLNVSKLPHAGTTVSTPKSETHPGGKCLNEAIGVSNLGHACIAIGRVGNDSDADYVYQSLKDYGVDTVGISRTKDQKTGQAFVFVPTDGDSMISIVSGANGVVTAQDISACEHLFINASHCLLNTEIPMNAVQRALEIAHRHGLMTVLKPSSIPCIAPRILKNVDLLVPNMDELDMLCPGMESHKEKMAKLLQRGIDKIVVTDGERGCALMEAGNYMFIPAIKVSTIDTTGAGDSFISSLVSYLIYGYNFEQAARIATYAAAISTTRQGASSSLVDRLTLEAFIRKYEPDLLLRRRQIKE